MQYCRKKSDRLIRSYLSEVLGQLDSESKRTVTGIIPREA